MEEIHKCIGSAIITDCLKTYVCGLFRQTFLPQFVAGSAKGCKNRVPKHIPMLSIFRPLNQQPRPFSIHRPLATIIPKEGHFGVCHIRHVELRRSHGSPYIYIIIKTVEHGRIVPLVRIIRAERIPGVLIPRTRRSDLSGIQHPPFRRPCFKTLLNNKFPFLRIG